MKKMSSLEASGGGGGYMGTGWQRRKKRHGFDQERKHRTTGMANSHQGFEVPIGRVGGGDILHMKRGVKRKSDQKDLTNRLNRLMNKERIRLRCSMRLGEGPRLRTGAILSSLRY